MRRGKRSDGEGYNERWKEGQKECGGVGGKEESEQ